MSTIFHFDPISPNFLGSRSEREILRKFNVDTSQNFSSARHILIWYPISNSSLENFTFTAVHFRPKVWSNVAANRSTHCTVRSHSTKSCSFPVLTLAQFFHLTVLTLWRWKYSCISSLSSSDWAELAGILRRHIDPKKALEQVQILKTSSAFQTSSITFLVFFLHIDDVS